MNDYQRMRHRAGLADLQEWARFEVSGPAAGEVLDSIVGCNVRDLYAGRAANTLIPSPGGGVDAIVWVLALESGFRVLGEPGDREAIASALDEGVTGRDAAFTDEIDEQFAIALIGPEAERIALKAFGDEVRSISFLNALSLGPTGLLAARIGYLGEYELHLFGPPADKESVVDALMRAEDGEELLVSKDAFPVMMTEMRTLSRKRDIPPSVSVFEAGLQWMVDFRKENLRAAGVLDRTKRAIGRKCVLMIVDGADAEMAGQSVFIEALDIGRIQSAFFSPTLGRTVALAYLADDMAVPGLSCTVGENRTPGRTVSAPAFLGRSILDGLN